MKHLRLLGLFAFALTLIVLASSGPGSSRSEAMPDLPAPHLGYGLNIRGNIDMADGLGFDWIKLYEDLYPSPDDFPAKAAQYHVLYRVKAEGQPFSLDVYLAHVQQLVLAGRGKVNAYEIGNEPNLKMFWGGQNPNPEQYGRLLCRVHEVIKSVDPDAFVVSAGLAPVGRTRPQDWVYAMDDRVFAQRMFDAILAAYPTRFPCMDAFGYHPQGYPYPPEIEASQLPPDDNGNDFRFRATEWFHTLTVNYTIGYLPIWPTEFGWLRDASTDAWDGAPPWDDYGSFCWNDTQFRQWSWMRVSEAQQADYLVRAFQYADTNMPWLGPMFVYNIDWNSQGWECDHVKFFSIFKAATGRPDSDPLTKVPSLAVQALANMPKRSAFSGPALTIQPTNFTFLTEVTTPTIQTGTLNLANASAGTTFTWTIAITATAPITPLVTPISGTNAATVTVRVDTSPITRAGTYAAELIVSALPPTTVGSPITIPVNIIAVDQLNRICLPLIGKDYSPPPPQVTSTVTSTFGLAFVSSAEAPASDDRYQHAITLSATFNRWPMYWPSIEKNPTGQPRIFDWSKQDANISADISHGLTPLPILMLTPIGLDTAGSRTAPAPKVGDGLRLRMNGQSTNSLAAPSSQGSPPQGLTLSVFTDGTDTPGAGKVINPDNRWAYFVNAAVTRFMPGGVLAQAQGWTNGQGIRHWEIWNEEDIDQFFIGTPTDYARLLKVAYLSAKQADPNATIVFGGMAHFQRPNWLDDVLNVIATDPMSTTYHGFMDAVASHNYAWAWQTFDYLYQDRSRLDHHGLTNVKLWLTETGVPVCNDLPYVFCPSAYRATMSEQADFVIQTMAYAVWLNTEVSIWFNLYDDCGNDSHYDAFGLVRNPAVMPACPATARNGTPRASFDAYKTTIQLLSGAQPYWRDRRTGTATDWTNGNQEIFAFKHPSSGQRVVMMWSRYYMTDTLTLTATSSSARLILPDGSSSTIYPTNSVYTISLPAATNAMTPTGDGSAPIGGSPRIVLENDPAVTP